MPFSMITPCRPAFYCDRDFRDTPGETCASALLLRFVQSAIAVRCGIEEKLVPCLCAPRQGRRTFLARPGAVRPLLCLAKVETAVAEVEWAKFAGCLLSLSPLTSLDLCTPCHDSWHYCKEARMLHLLTSVCVVCAHRVSCVRVCLCVADTMFVDLVITWMLTIAHMADKTANLCIAVSCSALPFRWNCAVFVRGIGSHVPKCSCTGSGEKKSKET